MVSSSTVYPKELRKELVFIWQIRENVLEDAFRSLNLPRKKNKCDGPPFILMRKNSNNQLYLLSKYMDIRLFRKDLIWVVNLIFFRVQNPLLMNFSWC